MPRYGDQFFWKACKALAKQAALKKVLRKKYGSRVSVILRHFRSEEQLPPELEYAYDDVIEFLKEEAPVIKGYLAETEKGVYPVTIRGFPGAYFVEAMEYDDSEVLVTLREARDHVMDNFGEYLS